jgi:hypothetical protein
MRWTDGGGFSWISVIGDEADAQNEADRRGERAAEAERRDGGDGSYARAWLSRVVATFRSANKAQSVAHRVTQVMEEVGVRIV